MYTAIFGFFAWVLIFICILAEVPFSFGNFFTVVIVASAITALIKLLVVLSDN